MQNAVKSAGKLLIPLTHSRFLFSFLVHLTKLSSLLPMPQTCLQSKPLEQIAYTVRNKRIGDRKMAMTEYKIESPTG